MKLATLHRRAVEIGMDADPRGKKMLAKLLKKEKEQQAKLEGIEKDLADHERTWNPYADTRVINGTGEEDLHHLLVGIDIETPELLLADRLREHGEKIDGVLIHHPEGRPLADLEKVMPLQVDILGCLGVPVAQAEAELGPRMDRIHRAIHADNLFRTERAAELLGFPALCCHTVTDNLVYQFIEKIVCKKEYDDLGEILNSLLAVSEYRTYAVKGNSPIIVNGAKNGRPGKITASAFTGGTNGPEQFIEQQARAGVGTILSMHVTEKDLEEAKKHHVNIIQCSHIASDTIGINLLLDQLQKEEKRLTIREVAGFIRVKRTR